MLIAGTIAAIGIIFLLLKFNLKRIVKFDIALDVLITFFFVWIFLGTFSGMMAGLMAGALVSVFLFVTKKFMPKEELVFVKSKSFPYRKFIWVQA
jgi:membrane protein CcdC involved in cytochrome C biogenesis